MFLKAIDKGMSFSCECENQSYYIYLNSETKHFTHFACTHCNFKWGFMDLKEEENDCQ